MLNACNTHTNYYNVGQEEEITIKTQTNNLCILWTLQKNIYLLDEEVFSCKNTLCVREGRGSHIRKEIIHQSDSLTPRRHNAIISSFETRAVLLYGDTVLSSPDYLVSKQHAVSFSRGSRLSLRQYGESWWERLPSTSLWKSNAHGHH